MYFKNKLRNLLQYYKIFWKLFYGQFLYKNVMTSTFQEKIIYVLCAIYGLLK